MLHLPTLLASETCNLQGARVASAMAAANPDKALACIFFSYPLHTPNNQVQHVIAL